MKPPVITFLICCLLGASWCQAAVQVTDDLGNAVTLNAPAQRVVTLAPHATELVLAIGAASTLAAVADFFDYPASIAHIPRVQGYGQIDRERLLLLQPDLVIAWASGNHPGDLQWIRSQGIAIYLSEPDSLQAIGDSLKKIGILLGRKRQGSAAAKQYFNTLDKACAHRIHHLPERVYYQIWPKPPMTIGGRHWLNQILRRAGLRNVFADVDRSIVTISPEALASRNIQRVIATPGQEPDWLHGIPVLHSNPELGRPGPRIPEGLKKLCDQL